jgi:hypothetical protein
MLMIVLACAAPVIASYFTYYVIRPQARTNYGDLIQPSRGLPASAKLPLVDLQGASVDPQRLRGQWLLVVVGDGDCDATCEKLLYAQRQFREMTGKEKDRVDRVWLVTGSKPVRENLLPALAQAWVLRTDEASVAGWLAPQTGARLQDHLYLIDPMGEWMMRFPPEAEPPKVKKDLERLLRAAAFWDQPSR